MRVLVTRGQPEADALARRLQGLGHEAQVEPMLQTRLIPGDPAASIGDLAGVQALLFTSANGVRAFAVSSDRRGLPVFAVGDTTAAAARAAGFGRVESADGNVEDLAALVVRRLDRAAGALFHGAARQVAGDLKGALESAGFTLRRAVLYEAVAAERLSPSAAEALSGGGLDAVMFFSPRTAETFVRLVQAQALTSSLVGCHALCLSAAVAAKIEPLGWAGVVVAERPTEESLLAGLSRLHALKGIAGREKGKDDRAMDGNNGSGSAGSNGANGSEQAPALAIIAAFGGIRPMATKLGIAVSTVQGWRERAVIPVGRHDEVRAAAKEQGVVLDEDLLAASALPPSPEALPRPAVPSGTQAPAAPAERPAAAPGPAGDAPPRAPEGRPREAGASRPPPASPPPPPPEGLSTGRMGLIVGVGVAVIVLILVGAFLAQPGGEEELETRISALAERVAVQEAQLEAQRAAQTAPDPALAALESRLAALEQRPAVDEAAMAAMADLQDRMAMVEQAGSGAGARASAALQALSSRVDALEADADIAAAGTTALDKRLVELDRRLTALEEVQSTQGGDLVALGEAFAASGVGDSVSDASLALALGQLRDALRASDPYETELALVRGLVEPDDELGAQLDLLQAKAAGGVPSLAQLKAAYPQAARRAASAGLGDEAEGLLSGVLRRVSEVVTIRPVGEVEGSGVGPRLARAEARLEADDLAGAVAQLEGLEPAAAAPLSGWLEDARARLAADAAVAELGLRAVSKLGGADG